MKVIKDLIYLLLPVVVHLTQTTGTGLKRFGFVLFINVLFIKLYLGLDQHFHAKDSFSGIWNMFLRGANNILPWLKLSMEISSTKRHFLSCLLSCEREEKLIFCF